MALVIDTTVSDSREVFPTGSKTQFCPLPYSPIPEVPDVVKRAFQSMPGTPLTDKQMEGVYKTFRERTSLSAEPALLDALTTGAARSVFVAQGRGYAIMDCDLEGDELIAEGGYKAVYHGVGLHDGVHYAIGVCDIAATAFSYRSKPEDIIGMLDEEAYYSQTLSGKPGVLETPDVFYNKEDGKYYFIMKFCEGGNLKGLIQDLQKGTKTLSLLQRVQLSRQILQGILEAHKEGIIHRDIKPENILLDGKGRPRLGDFGLAALMSDDEALKKRVGTRDSMAPEIAGGKPATAKYDAWSAGVVLYNLLALKCLPFEDHSQEVTPTIPQDPEWGPPLNFVAGAQEEAIKELLALMLKVDPKDRISIEGALERLEKIENSILSSPADSPAQSPQN